MTMAAALSGIVWRMLRNERQRSEARVTVLSALAERPSKATGTLERRPAVIDLPIRQLPVTTAAPLFAEPAASSPWAQRLAVMAALGLILASAILFALTASNRKAIARSAPSVNAPAAGGRAAGFSDAQAAAGLELLSLRDSREPGALMITGLVRNPRTGVALSRVTVTAYAFDDKGAFLASGRALIDVTSLAPGDESPFVVSVPVTESVARYRIGFRSDDGRVISHIDKRQQQGPVASNWSPS
jgi:hypothetical protein